MNSSRGMTVEPKGKPGILDRILAAIKKLLRYCLSCVTCGCFPGSDSVFEADGYEVELLPEERDAVQSLLQYLDSDDAKDPSINNERLRALCIITYSDNEELQRSAALCFAEISKHMRKPVSEIVLEPLVVLLRSRDAPVQKAASLAISNFALNGPESNKKAIMNSGALQPLLQLLNSNNVEVQCNTCGCITTLATNDNNKEAIVNAGGVKPLLTLAKSKDIRVQRNATGALLNLTHLQSNRNELVYRGALPILVEVLHSPDPDVEYYCAAALSNLAVNEKHRSLMVAVGHYDVLNRLITLLSSSTEKVSCQVCLALRNLATDGDNQPLIANLGGLRQLHKLLNNSNPETCVAALACLRNLSIHRANETSIISETFLSELKRVVVDSSNPQAQVHAAGTIRNLAAGDHIEEVVQSNCMQLMCEVLLAPRSAMEVTVETSAALAVLADDDSAKRKMLSLLSGDFYGSLVKYACQSENSELQYNAAGILGQLSLEDGVAEHMERHMSGVVQYLREFLSSRDASFVHIALWTAVQLSRFSSFLQQLSDNGFEEVISQLSKFPETEAVRELAQTLHQKMAQC